MGAGAVADPEGMTLPTAHTSAYGCFVTADGTPAWPVTSEHERDALATVATLFGARLASVDAKPGSCDARTEVVLSLGERARAAGRLYAHLTRRTYEHASSLRHVVEHPEVRVVIADYSAVTSDLLEMIYVKSDRQVAPGLITAPSGDELMQQVLLKAAVCQLAIPSSATEVEIYPGSPIAELSRGVVRTLGNLAAADAVRKALSSSPALLTCLTHSSGFDAPLHPDLVLCSVRGDHVLPTRGDPTCIGVGGCTRIPREGLNRERRPVAMVPPLTMDGRHDVVRPEEFAARVFVWHACWGLLPSNSLIDRSYNLGLRFACSPNIGATITPWKTLLASPELLEPLLLLLRSGLSLGRCVAVYNNLPSTRQAAGFVCLLGDPSVQAVPQERGSASFHGRALEYRQRAEDVPFIAKVVQRVSAGLDSDARSMLQNAFQEVTALEARGVDANATSAGATLGRLLISGIFHVDAKFQSLWDWNATRIARTPVTCNHCGACADIFLGAHERPRRSAVLCPVCGLVADAPSHWNVRIEYTSDGSVRMVGDVPPRSTAGVLVDSGIGWNRTGSFWPTDSSGYLLPECPLEPSLAELHWAWVVLVSGTDIGVYSKPARAAGSPVPDLS
jgi:hypothetical protein